MIRRMTWYKKYLEDSSKNVFGDSGIFCGFHRFTWDKKPVTFNVNKLISCEPNLVGSLGDDGKQYPVLDFDFGCVLQESSTTGHYHLFIQKPLTHDQYAKLLEVMNEVGLIEKGIVNQFKASGQTFARLHKEQKNPNLSSSNIGSQPTQPTPPEPDWTF